MSSIYPLVAALLANVIAQVLKPIVLYFRTKELDVHQVHRLRRLSKLTQLYGNSPDDCNRHE